MSEVSEVIITDKEKETRKINMPPPKYFIFLLNKKNKIKNNDIRTIAICTF